MKRRTSRGVKGRLGMCSKGVAGRALVVAVGLAALGMATAIYSGLASEAPSSESGENRSRQMRLAPQGVSEITRPHASLSAKATQNRMADSKATSPADPKAASATNGLGAGTDSSRFIRLKENVLDLSLAPELRREALAELTRSGVEALSALASVASARFESPDEAALPHSIASAELSFEKGLRITALEAIDQLAAQGKQTREALTMVLTQQFDRDIRLLANVSLSGVEQGRPGKLTRFIDQSFEEIIPK